MDYCRNRPVISRTFVQFMRASLETFYVQCFCVSYIHCVTKALSATCSNLWYIVLSKIIVGCTVMLDCKALKPEFRLVCVFFEFGELFSPSSRT
jgi:hypothetical protein